METKYNSYDEMHKTSIENPTKFWGEQAKKVHWFKAPTKVLDDSNKPLYRWFPDGETNITYNCLDLHAKEHPDKIAFIYEGPIAKEVK